MSGFRRGALLWRPSELAGCTVLRPSGVLDWDGYRRFGDDLVRYAVDRPRAVVVVVDDLDLIEEAVATACASARVRVSDWPHVPIVLVADGIANPTATVATRHRVPAFASVEAALRSLPAPPPRREASIELAPSTISSMYARRFVTRMCDRWGIGPVRTDALLVATELVENALLHAFGEMRLCLESQGGLLTIAVADADPQEAMLREPVAGHPARFGLHVVASLARAWGCAPRWPVGKVVWATLADHGRPLLSRGPV
ncbi:ATP-binding protein [Nocardia lijiangensis]|uniref:ATP-binding protein n=1 Tax=Nocardia lijiangensis TaxID=299618 RepID=UPI003D747DF1